MSGKLFVRLHLQGREGKETYVRNVQIAERNGVEGWEED
jgi:hypothetical protein